MVPIVVCRPKCFAQPYATALALKWHALMSIALSACSPLIVTVTMPLAVERTLTSLFDTIAFVTSSNGLPRVSSPPYLKRRESWDQQQVAVRETSPSLLAELKGSCCRCRDHEHVFESQHLFTQPSRRLWVEETRKVRCGFPKHRLPFLCHRA